MEADDLFQSLLTADEARLRSSWNEITEELETVVKQQSALDERRQRLEARKQILTALAQLRELEMTPDERRSTAQGSPGRPQPRELAHNVLMENPDRVWDGHSLKRELAQRGFQTSLSNTRVLLQRLVGDGRARRVGRGEYQAAQGRPASLSLTDGSDET